ncbi:magnesium transporter [Patescibacteria group bacterium]|nr:magnesium transporter [Patescibacteria group bacterium]
MRNNKQQLLEKLNRLKEIEREKHHPLIPKVHKKHNISKRTLFYIKEYPDRKKTTKTILRESIKVLLFASIMSSLGGIALERIEEVFLSIVPLVILLPALNDLVGNYGIVISSRFSTMLHTGKVKEKWWKTPELKVLFFQILLLTLIAAILSSSITLLITFFSEGRISFILIQKIILMVVIDLFLIIGILFFIAIFAGIRVYKKREDPNNFLIPITTGIADFANMAILALLVLIIF